MEDLYDLYRGWGKTLLKLTKIIRHLNNSIPFEWWVYSPLLKPKLIRGSETAKVDCPERVGATRLYQYWSCIYAQTRSLFLSTFWLPNLTTIISDDNWAQQSPFPSLDLSSRCSNLSRALSPEHANESAGSCSRDPFLPPRESVIVSILFRYKSC
jgi:hypothetical protein